MEKLRVAPIELLDRSTEMPVTFKIVDRFFGNCGGSQAFFGIGDEDRDGRRFDSEELAETALHQDRLHAAPPPSSKASTDRWGRRFMNLMVVPETYRWCRKLGEDCSRWQEPIAFKFDGPSSQTLLSYSVALPGSWVGTVESTSSDGRVWSARRRNNGKEGFCTAYEAAQYLLTTNA